MSEHKCPHCGEVENSEFDLEIFHRGCRLKANFPDCYESKNGILSFDVKKVFKRLEERGKEAEKKEVNPK